MARPKNPESRTETIATRVSAETAGKIARERGHLTRSEWLARLIEDHFESGASVRGAVSEAATEKNSPEVHPEPVPSAPAPARKSRRKPAAEPEPAPPSVVEQPVKAEIIDGLRDRVRQVEERPRCPHPGTRSIGGFCRHCQANVESGGWLPAGWVAPEGWES